MTANRVAAAMAAFNAAVSTFEATTAFYFLIIGNGAMVAFCVVASVLFAARGLVWLRRVEP